MTVYSYELELSTDGDGDVIDLSGAVQGLVSESDIEDGAALVFVPGSTAAVTALEYEPGGVHDLKAALDRLIPREGQYEHNRLNHDTNSHAHIRAAIVGPSETVPVRAGRLQLGTWQQLVLVDFDDRPRRRTVIIHVLA